jgi:hypothetical protein
MTLHAIAGTARDGSENASAACRASSMNANSPCGEAMNSVYLRRLRVDIPNRDIKCTWRVEGGKRNDDCFAMNSVDSFCV